MNGVRPGPESILTSEPLLASAPTLSSPPTGRPALSSASKFTSLFLPQGEGEAGVAGREGKTKC